MNPELVVLLLGAAASSTTSIGGKLYLELDELGRPSVPSPAVVLFPAVSRADVFYRVGKRKQKLRGHHVELDRLVAFSDAFSQGASDVFEWRRWRTIEGAEARELIEDCGDRHRADREGMDHWRWARRGVCLHNDCLRCAGRLAGASHWATAELLLSEDRRDCLVWASLWERATGERRQLERVISPCRAEAVLAVGEQLGRDLAEGPRAEPRVSLELTSHSIPSLRIPRIRHLRPLRSSTVTREGSRHVALGQALEEYRRRHVFAFADKGRPSTFYVTRGGELLDDCEVLRAAALDVPEDLDQRCRGNSWEWAWLSLPIGLAFMTPSFFDEILDGQQITFTFLFGAVLATMGPILALAYDEDPLDKEGGEHLLTRSELDRAIQKINASLRAELALGEAEVQVAGMRK